VVIHNVQTFDRSEHVVDPVRGPILKKEQVLKRGTIETVAHEGKTYKIDNSGSFNVPDEVAEFLLEQPGWYEGESPFPVEPKKSKKTQE
jgi:hypothetical protein